jgi:hypothetical protein
LLKGVEIIEDLAKKHGHELVQTSGGSVNEARTNIRQDEVEQRPEFREVVLDSERGGKANVSMVERLG